MSEITLKAIEQLLDKKLDEKLGAKFDAKLKFVASKDDITSIKGDISAIRGDAALIRGDVTAIRGDVTSLQGDVTAIRGDVTSLQGDVTAIKTGIVNLAAQESLNEIGDRLTTIEGILGQHTTSLDAIAKDVSNWNTEMIVMRDRMKRYEDALKLVGQKLNLDLQSLLR